MPRKRTPTLLLLVISFPGIPRTVGAQDASNPPGAPQAPAELPPVPAGVEVLTRGPVHEAFATPTTDPLPTPAVHKAPPKPLDEMPPVQKPEGDVTWIGGYWAWDDDRQDYLWVSGTWRAAPPGKRWVAGYWREDANQWQWVPGFWTAAEPENTHQQVVYHPAPPKPPEVAAPGDPPTPSSFYVPGTWVWTNSHYAWQAGYWANVQPGYVWVPAHYRWTPGGYLFIPGYWDLAVDQRGVLYAPVVVSAAVVGPAFVYTPAYVVREPVVLDALFVRPCYCHYYFGDYYGPAYHRLGFESCVVYSRRHYEPIFVYYRWEHREDPRWETHQLDVCLARHAGRAPLPPRTLAQQNIVINQHVTNVNVKTTNFYQNTVIQQGPAVVPASQLAAVKKINTVPLDAAARTQAREHAQAVQQTVLQRRQVEKIGLGGPSAQPRVATLSLPPAPAAKPAAAAAERPAVAAHPDKPVTPAPSHLSPANMTHSSMGPSPGTVKPEAALHAAGAPTGPPAPVKAGPPPAHPGPVSAHPVGTPKMPGSPAAPATLHGPVPPGTRPNLPPGARPPMGVPPKPPPRPVPANPEHPPAKPNGNGNTGPMS